NVIGEQDFDANREHVSHLDEPRQDIDGAGVPVDDDPAGVMVGQHLGCLLLRAGAVEVDDLVLFRRPHQELTEDDALGVVLGPVGDESVVEADFSEQRRPGDHLFDAGERVRVADGLGRMHPEGRNDDPALGGDRLGSQERFLVDRHAERENTVLLDVGQHPSDFVVGVCVEMRVSVDEHRFSVLSLDRSYKGEPAAVSRGHRARGTASWPLERRIVSHPFARIEHMFGCTIEELEAEDRLVDDLLASGVLEADDTPLVLPPDIADWNPDLRLAALLAVIDVTALSEEDRVRYLQASERLNNAGQARSFQAMTSISDAYQDLGLDMAEAERGAALEIRAALRMTPRTAEHELALAHETRSKIPALL